MAMQPTYPEPTMPLSKCVAGPGSCDSVADTPPAVGSRTSHRHHVACASSSGASSPFLFLLRARLVADLRLREWPTQAPERRQTRAAVGTVALPARARKRDVRCVCEASFVRPGAHAAAPFRRRTFILRGNTCRFLLVLWPLGRLTAASTLHIVAANLQSTPRTLASRAIRVAGLAIGLGLGAITAYQRRQAQMASSSHHGGQLDATADREVVYCHACFHDWYRDEHGLTCPECDSDITEIVDPDSDPREDDQLSPTPSSPRIGESRYEDYSDPEEADIEEHVGPHGFIHRRSVRNGPGPPHDPGVEPVLNRFYEMLEHFGQPQWITNGGQPTGRGGDVPPPWPRIHRTTFTSGTLGGGTASVTIFSGPSLDRQSVGHGHPRDAPGDPFQAIFSDVLRDIGPPQGDHQPPGPPPNFARGLQEILSLFSPANAMAGDAVYSQEALDRIITQLMEANPQSNAAPPASDAALQTLDRRAVDQEMLKGESKTECTICIDEMKIGDKAVFLACKHWFHEDCVVLWLREHNTCPICRTPVEKRGGNGRSSNDPSGDVAWETAGSRPGPGLRDSSSLGPISEVPGSPGALGGSFSGGFGGTSGGHAGVSTNASTGSAVRPIPGAEVNQVNDALRTISAIQQERDLQRGRRTPSQYSYDTSRLQRRTSISPTNPRETASAEYGARMRQRSPSESSRRGQVDGGSGRQTGQGPISWLRDRFSGGGGSNQGSSRDERRR
ncbi:RING finger protein [Tolypocladium capitatum]|uniref:RING-type E3 ubiquitin transferase n=1 Tax=Tolypocladium capitatum TaxID=45235 RepID=A0A2K3Q8U6_9HYPO|nr:RING finger protein [Tolypocladium capitatum]